jgi:hypothetical protein
MPLGWKRDERATKEHRRLKLLVSRLSAIDSKGRFHLKGLDMSAFRELVFERADGRCEMRGCKCCPLESRCMTPITLETGELHHVPGGYERHESRDSCFAICGACHRAAHVQVHLKSIPL